MTVAPFTLRFSNLDREAGCALGESVFQSARRAGIRVVGACGGRGVCGSCIVRVVSGKFELAQAQGEQARAAARADKQWVRACLVRPLSDCVVEVAPRSLAPVVRAEVDGQGATVVAAAPAVRGHDITVTAPTMVDGRADGDRVLEALEHCGAARIDIFAMRELPGLLRKHDWRVRASMRGDELLAVSAPGTRGLGLAVDLGTTNCAGFLMDLETGARIASLGIENPQSGYGADLISRVNHAIRSRSGADELRTAAVTGIVELARDLCEAVSADAKDVVDVAICGNTAMHHLLLGLPVSQLGRAPFVPAMRESIDVKTRALGIPVAPGAYAHLMPNVGGFVGGDHVAALLATEERWRHGTTIVMDIGTNTEVSLVHSGGITTVSCPSGPALEGGHISTGMRAAEGAIERVRVREGRLETQVIGEVEPVGVCGSGVLDAVAAMRSLGLIDARGAIRPVHPAVREEDGQRQVMLAGEVGFAQGDVRAVQLAKAAIRSGIDLLLRTTGLEESALDQVVIAGAFGAYINVESAIAIGLLPPLPQERFVQVGNAAGVGVRMALASTALRERSRALAQRCHYLELGSQPGFQKAFLRRISFDEGRES